MTNPLTLGDISGRAAEHSLPGLGRYYVVTGQAELGVSTVTHLVDTIMNESIFKTYSAEQQAVTVNAAQATCFNINDFVNAYKYGELVCKLEPTEPIWFSNLALVCYMLKDYITASTYFESARALYTLAGTQVDMDILETGIKIYAALGRKADLENCFDLLRLQSPAREKAVREGLVKVA